MAPGEDLQAEADVGHAPGHRALHRHQLERRRAVGAGDDRAARHPAVRGLQRRDAAAGRRVAQRPADVVAEADGAHPDGQRRALAAGGAAGGAGQVPRVAGEPVQARVGVDPQGHVRAVGAGDRDGTRRPHALDDGRVDAAAMASASAGRPQFVEQPTRSMFCFTVNGTPWSGPSAPPAARARSAAAAPARASSASTRVTAFTSAFTASIRSRWASTTSADDTSFAAIIAASRRASSRHRSVTRTLLVLPGAGP